MCVRGTPNMFWADIDEVQPYLKTMEDELQSYLFDTYGYNFSQIEGGELSFNLTPSAPNRQVVSLSFRAYLFTSGWALEGCFPQIHAMIQARVKEGKRTPTDVTTIHKAYVRYNLDGLRTFWQRREFEIVVELSSQ